MKSYSTALSGYLLLQAFLTDTEAFSPNHKRTQITQQPTTQSSLYFFGRNKDDNKDEKSEETTEKGGLLPFFGRRAKPEEAKQNVGDTKSEQPVAATPVTTAVKAEPVATPAPAIVSPPKPANAQEVAKSLRARAERMKLEAERMDAELTLEKIEKLERQLAKARTKGGAVDDLQRQMDNLQAKLRGEAPKPVLEPKREVTKKEAPLKPKSSDTTPPPAKKSEESIFMDRFSKPAAMLDTIKEINTSTLMDSASEDFEEILEELNESPSFLKKIMAATVEVDYDMIDDLNVTEIAVRFSMLRSGDYSYSTQPKPTFSQKEIEEEAKNLEDALDSVPVTKTMIELAAGNYTKLAIYGLEYAYYTTSKISENPMAELEKLAQGEEWLGGIIQAVNQSGVDRTIDQFFPKCSRKEDEVPTNAQVQMLASTVLPKTKFSATGKPEPVLGGFVIRGNHKYENGDELIAAIDKELEKSPLGDKMTVLYTDDFTLFSSIAEDEDFSLDFLDSDLEVTPLLYVLGPDICRESKPFQLSIVSALGLSTSWYLSIYPFLLNPGLSKRIEEQLGLAEAGMPFDLNWLTDLSLPFFYTFIGLQLSHEIAHRTIAGINNVKTSPPTFVPSLLTGVTSTVTTFRTPPKNREVMFDYAVAGPLVGLLASLAAVAVGTQLTLISDPATLPCLPLDILRQSTLGGGIIDAILGAGTLNVPGGSLGTSAVAGMTVPLHPVAIAGYLSLFVNALGLLPVGTTDGGRMALTLFGRGPKLVVGNIFLFATLLAGLTGSDLFLFYFSFVIAFQTGNEIPARNEVEEVGFSRIILATTAWSLAFLTLVPFQ